MTDHCADSTETRKLLDQLRNGDRGALEQLFSRHGEYLRRMVQLRWAPKLRARIDPDDVVQEVHMEAIRSVDDYLTRQPMPFRLWLRQTAAKCCRVVSGAVWDDKAAIGFQQRLFE